MKVIIDAISIPNNKGINKPNEDFLLYDENIGCAILLDGVSRDKENGVYPIPSPALEVSEMFARFYLEKVREYTQRNVPISFSLIRKIIGEGNNIILSYNKKLNHDFPAGTVGIIIHVIGNKVVYAYIGDCNGEIIKNSITEVFTKKQTALVAAHKKSLTTREIRYEICNSIEHPYGYGVLDGNEGAMNFVITGELTIEGGDVILLYTDGAEPAMSENSVERCINVNINDIIGTRSIATGEERPNSDDQSLIRISLAN